MKLNKMVFDDKKIEAAANKHIETEYARYNSGEVEEEMICLRGKDSFKAGAKWAINELMKKELSFLNKSFGLSVQVALGRMDGKNIMIIDYNKRRITK